MSGIRGFLSSKSVVLPIAFWAVVVLVFFFTSRLHHERDFRTLLLERGRVFFSMIETHRLWNARHGGVYVPVTDKTQPNPYLEDPLRDLTSTTGIRLTKINPAYMTRQVSEIASEREGAVFHITSLKLLRPENKADRWEADALREFEEGRAEKLELVGSEGEEVFRYMAPLPVEEPCLKCHGSQGYKIGDIRGGVSITISAAPALAVIRSHLSSLVWLHFGVFLAGVVAIVLFMHRAYLLRSSEKFLEDTFNSIQDGIIVVDSDLNIIKANASIEKMGSHKAPVVGRKCYEVNRDRNEPCEDCPTVRALVSGEAEHGELPYVDARGSEGWFNLFSFPMVDSRTGEVKGVIEYLQDISARKKAEALLQTVAGEVSTRTGVAYFELLVEVIAKELDAKYAFIGELISEDKVRTIALYVGGRIVENIEYELPGTPCENVCEREACFHHDGVQQLYPEDTMLVDMQARSYAGIPVLSSLGDTLGIIVALDVKAFEVDDRERVLSLLQIFASRVSSELERKQSEERIKASLEEKELLLKEVHHRVKNNMAIISSFLELQPRFIKDDAVKLMFRESRQRIKSMALVHEKLYKSQDFKDMDIREYIEELSNDLLRAYEYVEGEIAVRINTDYIHMDLDTLIPFGLIVNEILTNSLKHAFTDISDPEIEISLRMGQDNKAVLTVADNGTGIPDGELSLNGGLGLNVINALVGQLDGELEIDSTGGTMFRVIFPVKEIAGD